MDDNCILEFLFFISNLIILPACPMNPETAVTMHLTKYFFPSVHGVLPLEQISAEQVIDLVFGPL